MGRVIRPEEIGLLGMFAYEEFGNTDFSELDFHDTSEKYYIYIPKYYIARMIIHHLLTGAFLAFASYKYFIIPAVPFYVIYWFKLMQFYKWCPVVNISERKIKVFFIASLVLFNIIFIFVRGPIVDAFVNLVDALHFSRLSGIF